MLLNTGDKILFKSGTENIKSYKTIDDALQERNYIELISTKESIYINKLWILSSGGLVELKNDDDVEDVVVVTYSKAGSQSIAGHINSNDIDLKNMLFKRPMAFSSRSIVPMATMSSSNLYAIDYDTSMSLGGDGLKVDPKNISSGFYLDFSITYRNSNNVKRTIGVTKNITSNTRVTLSESEIATVIKDMGTASSLKASGEAKFYFSGTGWLMNTSTWTITINRGNTIGAPKSTNPTSPITVTIESGGSNNTLYKGISTITASFAYVDPGYGSLTQLRLDDSQSIGWNLLPYNKNKTGLNILRGATINLPDRWFSGSTTLRFRATNSLGQETILDSSAIRLKVVEYEGVGITSLTAPTRTDTTATYLATGTYNSEITSLPQSQISIWNLDGSHFGTYQRKDTIANGTNRWTTSGNIGGLRADRAYTMRITLTDSLGMTTVQSIPIGGSAVPLSLGKSGIGAGTIINDSLSYNLQVGPDGVWSQGPVYSEGNKVVTSTADMFQVLTQVQYNGLTTAQKNDPTKIYLIKL